MVNLLELIDFLRYISACEMIYARGGTTNGYLIYGLETDGVMERLNGEEEVAHDIDISSDSVSAGERM